jgi:hypothetical protein
MRPIVALIVLVFIQMPVFTAHSVASSLQRRIELGVQLGLNFAHMDGDAVLASKCSASSGWFFDDARTGVIVGGLVSIPIQSHRSKASFWTGLFSKMSIQSGLYYSQKGGILKNRFGSDSAKVVVDYLELPIVLKYRVVSIGSAQGISGELHPYFGASLELNIWSGTINNNRVVGSELVYGLLGKICDAGRYRGKLVFDIRFSTAFSNAFEAPPDWYCDIPENKTVLAHADDWPRFRGPFRTPEFKNHSVSFLIGYAY